MKKLTISLAITLMLVLALCAKTFAQSSPLRVKNPATFQTITFDADGNGVAEGTGYIFRVPSQGGAPLPYAGSAPEVFIYTLGQSPSGYFHSEEKKAGLIWQPSCWKTVYAGSPDGINYPDGRPVRVVVQAKQLVLNGQLMFMKDGRPAVASEKVTVYF